MVLFHQVVQLASFGNDNLSTTGTITGAANSKLADITFNDGSINQHRVKLILTMKI